MILAEIPLADIELVHIHNQTPTIHSTVTLTLHCGCQVQPKTVAISTELEQAAMLLDEKPEYCFAMECSWKSAKLTEQTP